MPITLNHSNISVQYSTGSNYIIETVKSDLYIRDSRTGISSNLTGEPVVTAPTFTETIRTFIHSGGTEAQTTYNIAIPQNTICDILMIGGGGAGGASVGGGGGAGGVVYQTNITLNAGSYTILVGKGGSNTTTSTLPDINCVSNGTSSKIMFQNATLSVNGISFEGKGGGGGGSRIGDPPGNLDSGFDGGSGGGNSTNGGGTPANSGSSTQGNTLLLNGSNVKGGYSAIKSTVTWDGGGGAGAGSANNGMNGGAGIQLDITGSLQWYAAGGGGGRLSSSSAGIGGSGIGGSGKSNTSTNGSLIVPTQVNGVPNTGSGGGGGGYDYSWLNGPNGDGGGSGGSGIVIIKFKSIAPPLTEGNPITHKTLNFTYDQTRYVEYQAQLKTGVGGWRIVRYLPPTSTTWYPINDNLAGTTSSGILYSYTNYWTVPFGTFDEFVFATFNMNYWLYCTKTTAYASYNNTAANIIKSSFSATPYTASWYNRGAGSPEDPLILIHNSIYDVVYAENSSLNGKGFISIDGGMCVLVRNSTTSTTISNPNTYTLDFPVPTTTDILERTAGRGILNNSNLILQGIYDINLTDATTLIVPRTGQYLPFTATSNLSQNIGFRYHLLNPIKMPEGAQWTYNSSNANVYYLGNVGIGTTNPSYNLDVRGTIFTSTGGYTQSGLTTWTVMSDKRIKDNIVKASYDKCLENVKNIELYNFNFKDNYVNTNDRHQLGFIAQEVQQVYPKAVEVGNIMLNTNDTIDNVLTLNTTQIKYTLYGAVKELINKVEKLETKINT